MSCATLISCLQGPWGGFDWANPTTTHLPTLARTHAIHTFAKVRMHAIMINTLTPPTRPKTPLCLPRSSESASVTVAKSSTEHGAWVLTGFTADVVAVVYPTARVPTDDDMVIRPVDGDTRVYNWWGYHEGGAGRSGASPF